MRTLQIVLLLLNMPLAVMAQVQQRTASNGQLLLQDIPEIPHNLADSLNPYHNTRSTGFVGWTLDSKSIYIRTRFGGVSQIHRVAQPGSAHRQLSFGEEPVGEVVRQPYGESSPVSPGPRPAARCSMSKRCVCRPGSR